MASKLRPYDKDEWEKIAREFLHDPKAPSSALDAAYIALRIDSPELAEDCREEALRRRKRHS
tara:strand:+ start:4323 stop:4508 length:186 start_codon:yes stop_codon:yes gene_type:complete